MNELSLKKINDEVFLATDDIVQFDQHAIQFIKKQAELNIRGRARICAHKDSTDRLHEMMIAIRRDSYIRPHRHHNKIESFHLIEGRADIVLFSEEGKIEEVVKLGNEFCFYYRLNVPLYHTLIIHSPVLVIHEITNGPFDGTCDFAQFAPLEDKKKITEYMLSLKQDIERRFN
jgi:cupin fold WbuC family metalloprotein